ncbi:malate synthase G [Pelagibacterales bacterium SAG-MED15]|nr:malate synthase G [Pelagibacterales bacterium SAG-MED15]
MRKQEQFYKVFDLSVSNTLLKFINKELLPGTGISKGRFWSGFNKVIHDLAPKNKHLIEIREKLQKSIDSYNLDNKGKKLNIKKYKKFLKKIGYLKNNGPNFKIQTKNLDKEISSICGPQLVCPVSNARFLLNAANARWVSLYDSLYGANIIPETKGALKGNTYNPIRGRKVIECSRDLLDKYIPLKNDRWKSLSRIPKVIKGNLNIKLKNQKQFVGYKKLKNKLFSLLFVNNNLHIDILFDQSGILEINNPDGNQDPLKIHDIYLESAISTICDHEDSVAAVDAEDKVLGYRNWLNLMKGTLNAKFTKNGKLIQRKLNLDKEYFSPNGKKITLHGRSLMLNRNVGHLMTNPAILLKDGSECPEGILDAFITSAAALHDFKRKGNSRTGSIYIVKPKMHGPEECSFTNLIFEKVEKILKLKKNQILCGIMDEERRTSINLKECIRILKKRVFFINTGFLDRTGDEIHTSMEIGPMVLKGQMKSTKWIKAYENNNVDVGLSCGFSGKAQIGKGMWAMPDLLKEMMVQKVSHPLSGANCAWVPSPTAAAIHALHYHEIDVFSKHKEIQNRKNASLDDLLTIPIQINPDWTKDEIEKELKNNAQGILGYVVRWIDQSVGCSKVPDINGVGLMEDRATCRISSQHISNWLHHGICSKKQVLEIMKKMAKVVDYQNLKDRSMKGQDPYQPMAGNYDKSIAFKAACDLVFHGKFQPSGYTEPLLHFNRIMKKSI